MRQIICLALFVTVCSATLVDHANVGVMYSMFDAAGQPDTAGIMQLTGMQIALDHINNKTDGVADDLLPSVELRMVARTPHPTFTSGAGTAIDMAYATERRGTIACAGPRSIEAMRGLSRVLADIGVPIVGYSLKDAELADWYNFQNVLRTNPLEVYSVYGAVDIAVHHDWRRVTVLHSEDGARYGGYSETLFLQHVKQMDMDVLSDHTVYAGHEKDALEAAMKKGANIFIIFMDPAAALPLLRMGHLMGVFGEGKQVIGTERMSTAENWAGLDVTAGELNTLLRGFIGVRWEETPDYDSVYYRQFLHSWYALRSTAGVKQSGGAEVCDNATDYYGEFLLHQAQAGGRCAGLNYSSFNAASLTPAFSAYDAIFAIARSYHALLEEAGVVAPGALYEHMLRALTFDGVTGRVAFSTEQERILFDIGGRGGDMSFRIVNYQYDESDPSAAGSFVPMMLWTSAGGISTSCSTAGCDDFRYNTQDNSAPKDRPSPVVREYPHGYRAAVYVVAGFNIVLVCYYFVCIFCFRKRRIVKVSQPHLSYIILLGTLVVFVSAMVSTGKMNAGICSVSYWLFSVGFGCIFIVLGLRLWRVHAVCGAMKRRVVTVNDVYIRLAVFMFALICVVAVNQFLGITTVEVTTTKNQFVYERELKCERKADGAYVVSLFIMLGTGLYFCVLTWNIDSTLSRAAEKIRAITAVALSLVIVVILNSLITVSPNQQRFVQTMITMIGIGYAAWVLYFDFCLKLLLGADLDRSLQEKRSAWSLSDIRFVSGLLNRFSHGRLGGVKTVPTTDSHEDRTKYFRMTAEELDAELLMLKNTIATARAEVVCVENVKYTLDDSTLFGYTPHSSTKGDKPA